MVIECTLSFNTRSAVDERTSLVWSISAGPVSNEEGNRVSSAQTQARRARLSRRHTSGGATTHAILLTCPQRSPG